MITNVQQQGATIVCSGPLTPTHPPVSPNVTVYVQNVSTVQVNMPQVEPLAQALQAPVVAFQGDGRVANVGEVVAPTPASVEAVEAAQAAQEIPSPWTAPAESQ